MENSATLEMTPTADAEFETAIGQYLNEMEHIKTQMAVKQQQIERLQAETQALIAALKVA